MREIHDVDLDYHVRHSALPHPGGQRELGVLVSRLHSHAARPAPAAVGGAPDRGPRRQPLRDLQQDAPLADRRRQRHAPDHARAVARSRRGATCRRSGPSARASARAAIAERDGAPVRSARPLGVAARGAAAVAGLSRAALDLGLAAVDDRALQAPYRAPALGPRRAPRRAAALRHPAVRARAPQARSRTRADVHAQRHRAVPQRQRPAPLPGRARARARPPADGRHPRQPARGRRPVDGHRDRDDGRRARHQRRRPARAPGRDQALDARKRSATSATCRPRRGPPTRC